MSQFAQWPALSENEPLLALTRGRSVKTFARQIDHKASPVYGGCGLKMLNADLDELELLVESESTVSDFACGRNVALVPRGGVSLDEWLDRGGRVQRL